jgi:anti-sigma-K factor RskA
MITRHPKTALVSYMRGELEGEERARVARHLESCASCRTAAGEAAAAFAELARRVEEIPPPDSAIYRAELHRKLGARRHIAAGVGAEPRWWRPRMAGLSLGALAAAAAALLLIFTMHQGARVAPPPLDQLATQGGAMQEGTMQEAAMTGADVGLLRDYPMVEHLDLLENYDVIAHLDEVSPSAPANDENRS